MMMHKVEQMYKNFFESRHQISCDNIRNLMWPNIYITGNELQNTIDFVVDSLQTLYIRLCVFAQLHHSWQAYFVMQ